MVECHFDSAETLNRPMSARRRMSEPHVKDVMP